MNQGPLLFLGLLAAMATSWALHVMVPQFQLGDLEMTQIEETGQNYPLNRQGLAWQGAEVYRAEGCQYCHTRFVLGPGAGHDLARGWGARRTVARDYLRDTPPMLGRIRFGPDLSNVGVRIDDEARLLKQLYDPRLIEPRSTMPRYRHLFEERPLKPGELRSPEALDLPVDYPLPEGVGEVVPKPAARALVAYLRSLRAEPLFFEVYPPPAPSPPAGAETNSPPAAAGRTNAPAPLGATNTPTEGKALTPAPSPAP